MPQGGDMAMTGRNFPFDGPMNSEGWQPKQTISERIATRNGAVTGDGTAAHASESRNSSPSPLSPLIQTPFPVGCLPEPMRSLVEEGAESLGCDPSMVALPAMAVAASAIGASRCIEVKPGYRLSPTIWALIVAPSGTAKSHALKLATAPLTALQADAFAAREEAMNQFRLDEERYNLALAAWRKDGGKDDPPIEPTEPKHERLIVSNTTIEALAPVLCDNPRGVLLIRDELGGWLNSFNAYRGGRGGDCEDWLSIYDSEPIMVDRKTCETIHVPAPHVSIVGTIQPDAFARAIGDRHAEDGLIQRFILAAPVPSFPAYTDAVVSGSTIDAWRRVVELLRLLEPASFADGTLSPIVVRMSPDAHQVWRDYHDSLIERMRDADDRVRAMLSKMRATAARIALILHLTSEAGLSAALETPSAIGAETVQDACAIAAWGADQAESQIAALGSDAASADVELFNWIQSRGGTASVREVARGPRRFRGPGGAEKAKAALEALADAGAGTLAYERSAATGPNELVFTVATPATATGSLLRG